MSQSRYVQSAVCAWPLCFIYSMGSLRTPSRLQDATGTPTENMAAEGSRSLACAATFLSVNAKPKSRSPLPPTKDRSVRSREDVSARLVELTGPKGCGIVISIYVLGWKNPKREREHPNTVRRAHVHSPALRHNRTTDPLPHRRRIAFGLRDVPDSPRSRTAVVSAMC